ncbi:unnamed protein product [Closterium sp. NIES-65]|nr:unnamed protein product [Closterium sp. NIES-65]
MPPSAPPRDASPAVGTSAASVTPHRVALALLLRLLAGPPHSAEPGLPDDIPQTFGPKSPPQGYPQLTPWGDTPGSLSSKDVQRLNYLGYADDTTLILHGGEQIAKAEEILDKFERASGLVTNEGKSVVLPLGANLGAIADGSAEFKWAGADDVERLLGVWVSPSGSGVKTWEKALERIAEKLIQWQQKYLTTTARATVVNHYIIPIISFQAQVYPPSVEVCEDLVRLLHSFTSGNRASVAKGFRLWSKELLYTTRVGGIGVLDPEIIITCLAARRVGLFLTEGDVLKKELMELAAELPLGADSFEAHEKLFKHWKGRSARWNQTCECLSRSPLCTRVAAGTREEILLERVVFNKNILLRGTTPIGSQKAANELSDLRLGELFTREVSGDLVQKSMAELAEEVGSRGAARLALKALGCLPAFWYKQLGFPTVLPRTVDSPPQLLILDGE